jgi:hypothetical protein
MIQQSLTQAVIALGNGKGFQLTGSTYDDFVVESADPQNPVVFDRDAVVAKAQEIEAQIPWDEMREKRNSLLAATDWTGNSDVIMSEEMKVYRQQLRDLPASIASPLNLIWPAPPKS